MQKSKTETLIQKYLSHQLNEQEFEELKQWLEEDASHKETFVKVLSLRNISNQLHLLHQFDKEASWKAIQKRCNHTRSIRRLTIYSSAAAIAVLIGIASILFFNLSKPASSTAQSDISQAQILDADITSKATLVLADHSEVQLYLNQQEIYGSQINNGEIIFPPKDAQPSPLDTQLLQNQIKVPKGSEYSIVLSDGTKVKMNADSHLDFPVQFADEHEREVTLEGEAFFDVTHDEQHPFIIKANDHTIYVLGTTFNVTAYAGEDITVTLVSGKIKVTAPTGEYILAPNEQYSSHTASISKVETELYTSWTSGAMEFDAMPLPDLLTKLSRCYNVDLKLASKELETMKFTGVIFRNKPLSFALEILHRVSDVKFERDGESILVKKQ